MGFLEIFGKALEWEESKKYHDIIRQSALSNLINFIKINKEKKCCSEESMAKFGYEVNNYINIFKKFLIFQFEFHKIHFDDLNKKAQIDLTAFDEIKKDIINGEKDEDNKNFITQFEFGKWMIEGKNLKKIIILLICNKIWIYIKFFNIKNIFF